MSKWCSYCSKDTHSDAECWCTRVREPSTIFPSATLTAFVSVGNTPPAIDLKTDPELLAALMRACK
jgi:hypothetical protein